MDARHEISIAPDVPAVPSAAARRAARTALGVLLREPLAQFLVLGLLLAGAYYSVRGADARESAVAEIVVTKGRVASLAETFTRTQQRPPTEHELRGLVDDYVREEVLYREAVAIGLDRDDTIVRRRLRQKLEFISEDVARLGEPTTEDLGRYLAAHPDAFETDARVSFGHVYLNADRRGDGVEADAARLLAALNGPGRATNFETAGDAIMLDPTYRDLSEADVAAIFGREFAERLRGLPEGTWAGPVRSGFGVHLVRIVHRTAGRIPGLDEVRDAVTREWGESRRREMLEAQYQALRGRYTVKVEPFGNEVGDAAPQP